MSLWAANSPRVRSSPGFPIAVAALTLIAFGLRVSQIDQSIAADEVFTYQDIFHRSFYAVLTTVHTGGENSPPLFFLLAWLTAKLGDPTVWLRLPSILLGAMTVPIVYLIGRRTVGALAALIGAAIVALSPFSVFYGVEARPYATMAFFVAASTLALLHAIEEDSPGWWAAYAVAAAGAAYSHYTSVFVLAVQAAWSLWTCRDRIRPALIANAAIVVAYVPWLPHVRGKLLGVIGVLYPLGTRRVLTDLPRPIVGHPSAPLHAIPTTAGLIAIGAFALAGLAVLVWRRSGPVSPDTALVVLLAFATPVGLLLYSLIVTDIWLPRGLTASLPTAALVLGALFVALPRPLTVLAAAATVVLLLAGTVRSFDAVYGRGPYRHIASYLDRVAPPRAPVTLESLIGRPAVEAEFKRPHVVVELANLWGATAPGGSAYLVLDDVTARARGITTPHPPGFQLVSIRRYSGPIPTQLLSYRRAPSRKP